MKALVAGLAAIVIVVVACGGGIDNSSCELEGTPISVPSLMGTVGVSTPAPIPAFQARFGTATTSYGQFTQDEPVKIIDVLLSPRADSCPTEMKNVSHDTVFLGIEAWIPVSQLGSFLGQPVVLNGLEDVVYVYALQAGESRGQGGVFTSTGVAGGTLIFTDFIDGVRVAGNFDVMFDNNEVSGVFDVPFCTAACGGP